MKRAIPILIVALALASWTAPAMAQEGEATKEHAHGHKNHDPAAHVAHLREELDLTDAQAAEIEAIVTEAMERGKAIHEGEMDDQAPEEMRALHERTMARVSEVLTEEQRAKLEAMHEEMKARHEGGHGEGGHCENGKHRGDGNHEKPDADRT